MPNFKTLRLRITGGITTGDRQFVKRLTAKLESYGFRNDVEFVPEFDRPNRLNFLKSLSVLSVPVPAGEAFGAHLIEAMAAGVPVVQPRAGAFPELVEATGGGVIYDPNNADTLAATLKSLLVNPEHLRTLGRRGKEAVEKSFSIERMAEDTLRVYKSIYTGR
jgi:glycosyltransferase involved in cell wall biosynthesis